MATLASKVSPTCAIIATFTVGSVNSLAPSNSMLTIVLPLNWLIYSYIISSRFTVSLPSVEVVELSSGFSVFPELSIWEVSKVLSVSTLSLSSGFSILLASVFAVSEVLSSVSAVLSAPFFNVSEILSVLSFGMSEPFSVSAVLSAVSEILSVLVKGLSVSTAGASKVSTVSELFSACTFWAVSEFLLLSLKPIFSGIVSITAIQIANFFFKRKSSLLALKT